MMTIVHTPRNTSVEAILEINAKAAELGQKQAGLLHSEKRSERKAGKAAVTAMLEMQIGIVDDLVKMFSTGITFETWYASFKKWNTPRNWERMGLKAQGRQLYKRMMEEGDFEKYYEQHVVTLKDMIPAMAESNTNLVAMLNSVRNMKV